MNKKKLLALLLALVMTLSLVPMSAIAEELETVTPVEEPAEVVPEEVTHEEAIETVDPIAEPVKATAIGSVSSEAMNEVAEGCVAQVDEVGYSTFADARAAWTDGTTLTLLADVSLTERTEINTDVTLDLNGKTLTGGSNMFYVTSGKLTIQDTSEGASGVYTSTAGNGDYGLAPQGYKGAVTLRGGSFELMSGTVNGSSYAVRTATGSGTITVSGGTLTGMYPIYDGQGTYNIVVTDGKLTTSAPNGSAIYKTTAGSVTISGGEIEALGNSTINTSCVKCGQYGSGSASLTISGGTFYAPYGCLIEMGTGTLTVTDINVTKVGYAPFYNCDKINAASRVSAGDYTSAGYRPTLKAGTLNGGSFRKADTAYVIDYLVDGFEAYVDENAVILENAPEGFNAQADYNGKAFFLRDDDVTEFFPNRDPNYNPHQTVTIYQDASFNLSRIYSRLGDTMTVRVADGATYSGNVTFEGEPYHPEMYLDVTGPTSENGFTTTTYTLKEHPFVTLYTDGNRESEGVSYGTVKSAINAIATNNTDALIVAEEGIAYVPAVIDGNNKSFTYDLNGQHITDNTGSAYNTFLSPRGNGSVVNVIDSVGTAAVNNTYNFSVTGLIGDNYKIGTLNVHGGEYTAKIVISIGAYYSPVFNIDGGTYNGKVNMANGTLNISGNSIFNGAFTLSNTAAVNITGGYFNEAAYNSLKDSANVTLPEGKALVKATGEYADYYTVGIAPNYVAQIGDDGDKFESLQEAINAAQPGETIKLLANIDATGYTYNENRIPISKSLTIDGQNHIITVANRGFGVGADAEGDIDVTFKNVTINNTSSAARCIDTRGNLNSLTLDHVTLSTDGASSGYTQPLTISGNQSTTATINITNSTIKTNDDATAYYAIITFTPVNMTIDRSTIKGWGCIFAREATDSTAGSAGSVFNITNSTLVSKNIYNNTSNAFAAVMIRDDNVTVNIEDTDITIYANSDQKQGVAAFVSNTANSVVNLKEGNKVTLAGTQLDKSVVAFNSNFTTIPGYGKIAVTGGLFSKQVAPAYCADGYICVANPDTETNTAYPYMVKAGTLVAEVFRPIEGSIYYNYVGGYETLQAAIDAAQDGDTVVLLENIEIGAVSGKNDSAFTVRGKDITIDGNDQTITANGDGKGYVFRFYEDSNNDPAQCVLMNLTVNSTGYQVDILAGGSNAFNNTLSIDNVHVSTEGEAVYASDSAVITATNSSFAQIGKYKTGMQEPYYAAATVGYAGILTLTDCEISAVSGSYAVAPFPSGGTINLNNTVVNGDLFAWIGNGAAYTPADSIININSGKVNGNYGYRVSNNGNGHIAQINVNGGVYTNSPANQEGVVIKEGYQVIANTEIATSADYPYTIGKVQVDQQTEATVTVDVEDKVEYTGAPTTVTENVTVKGGIDTHTSVSGVALTNNLVGETNGVQLVVDAARTMENSPLTEVKLQGAATVEVKVDVTVVPKEYDAGKTFTFSLTPTATVTTKDENGATTATVSGVEVDNTMIDQTQDIEVTLYTGFEPALLTHRDDAGNVIGSYTEGDTASDSTFTYDEDAGTCTLIIHHFSTIEATASDSVASVDFEGGSLRRRVLVSAPNTVVNYETDFRMKFAFNLPDGATVITDNSYFYWSTSNTNPTASDRKIQITSINSVGGTLIDNVNYSYWAAMIIKGVPSSAFDTPIYCKMHLEYELDGKTYAVEMSANKTVKQIATGLAALDSTDTNLKWIEYGKYLLGDRTSYTLSEFN